MKTQVSFRKFDAAKQIVYGIVYSPMIADSQGDWASAESIEKMAHDFNAKNRAHAIDIEHNLHPSGAAVVESFIARKGDPDYPEGAWAMGIRTPDDIWELVKAKKINGLSMYGKGERVKKGLPDQPTAKHELINGEILSVSLVGRAANMETFTMTKSDDAMKFLADQMQALATHMMSTNQSIRAIKKQQDALDKQIASLSASSDGRVRKAVPTVDPNSDAINRQLRKRERAQERLYSYWERPDLYPDTSESELRKAVQKAGDKLYELNHQDERATLDSGSVFLLRGGRSDFLQATPSSLDDILGISRNARGVRKAYLTEDDIAVENCLIL